MTPRDTDPRPIVALAVLGIAAAYGCLSARAESYPLASLSREPSVALGAREEKLAEAPTMVPLSLPKSLPPPEKGEKRLALTVDDGPHAGYTQKLLGILAVHGAKTTMFMIGKNVLRNPELARMAVSQGHEIGNHTYSHRRLTNLSDDQIRFEIIEGANAIENVTGFRPVLFRPPGGDWDARVVRIASELGQKMVLWTGDAGDFTTAAGNPPVERIVSKVLRTASPNGVIIIHDPMPSTLDALPFILQRLRNRGFNFVTCSQLGTKLPWSPRVRTRKPILPTGRPPVPGILEPGWDSNNENSEQGTPQQAAQEIATDQGTDQRGKSGQIDTKEGRNQEIGTDSGRAEAEEDGIGQRQAQKGTSQEEGRTAAGRILNTKKP